jgi:5-(carboxyamino)imidazole ribonucleotide synthase
MIKTIGIIGGGQLGQMMVDSLHQQGFKSIVLDPNQDCPCSHNSDEMIVGAYDDRSKVEELCRRCDVVTYEFENVGYELIEEFSRKYNIIQGAKPLYLSQHRVREKNSAIEAGLSCPEFRSVGSLTELNLAIKVLGYPAVLKTCSGGYDGKGQVVVKSDEDLAKCHDLVLNNECVLESFVNFDCEISVVVSRGENGQISTLPVGDNYHYNNILDISVLPSTQSAETITKALQIAKQYVEYHDFIGTITVELFVVGEKILFNEMAPRPHNSGHYSIEGATYSQFDQHIKAVTEQEIKENLLVQKCVMINVLGQDVKGIKELEQANIKNVYIHMYGKEEAKHNRKMGHVTILGYSYQDAIKIKEKYWRR